MNKLLLIVMGIFTSFISFAQTIGKEVKIPEEKFAVVESTVDDKPAIIVVNTSLRKFKHKKLNWREHQTGLILLFYVSMFLFSNRPVDSIQTGTYRQVLVPISATKILIFAESARINSLGTVLNELRLIWNRPV